MNKKELRAHFLALRQNLSLPRKKEAALHLYQAIQVLAFSRLASFCSTKDEIDTQELNAHFASLGRLLLPKRHRETLQYYLVSNLKSLQPTQFGLLEPDPACCTPAALASGDLILVPGLAFDAEHFRLGYGKGHFDHFLAAHPNIPTAGIGFQEQLSAAPLPHDPWDRPMQKLMLF